MKSKSLKDDPLWKEAYELTSHVYEVADKMEEAFRSEKWRTASKLRNAANDSLYDISKGVGNKGQWYSEADWIMAGKNLSALQAMYMFGMKENLIDSSPEIILRIDKLLEEVEKKASEAAKQLEHRNDEEMKLWKEKYRIWGKMQGGK